MATDLELQHLSRMARRWRSITLRCWVLGFLLIAAVAGVGLMMHRDEAVSHPGDRQSGQRE